MSIDLILGICGVIVTILVVAGMVLAVPANTERAYDPTEHPDGTDHGSPSEATAITADGRGIRE